MKILAVFFLIFCLSCNQNKESRNTSYRYKTDSRFLLYSWSICSIKETAKDGSESVLSFNGCSGITFKKDQSGYFKRADGEILPFTWVLTRGKLLLSHKGKYEKDALLNTDGVFKVLQINRKEFTEVDLTDTVEKNTYILGR